jgi:hypothetical protein
MTILHLILYNHSISSTIYYYLLSSIYLDKCSQSQNRLLNSTGLAADSTTPLRLYLALRHVTCWSGLDLYFRPWLHVTNMPRLLIFPLDWIFSEPNVFPGLIAHLLMGTYAPYCKAKKHIVKFDETTRIMPVLLFFLIRPWFVQYGLAYPGCEKLCARSRPR